MESIVLIDGNSLMNRAYYAVSLLTNKDGVYTNAVYGFVNMLIKVITDNSPSHIVVAFDVKAPTFRHKMYDSYKLGRKPMPEEFKPQFDTVKKLLSVMNIKTVEQAGIEADDILGTLAKRFGQHTIILTGDRDALQLVDSSTEVWLTKKGLSEIETVTDKNIEQLYGVSAAGIIELKSLMGDQSDNIPGVSGVGEVTALKLLTEYKTLDGVYEHINDISGKLQEKLITSRDNAYLSHTLATIKIDCDIDCQLSDCEYSFPFSQDVKELFEYLQFNSFLKRDKLFTGEVIRQRILDAARLEEVTSIEALGGISIVTLGEEVAINIGDSIRCAISKDLEYSVSIKEDLLSSGISYDEALLGVSDILASAKKVIVFDIKTFKKRLLEYNIEVSCDCEDLALMAYVLGDGSSDVRSLLSKNGYHNTDILAADMLSLYKELSAELEQQNLMFLYQTELKVAHILLGMERVGCKVDVNVLNELGCNYSKKVGELESAIYELAGKKFNISSPKQLGVLLFEELKLDCEKKTKTGYSTDIEVLEGLYNQHAIVPLVIEYRQYVKLMSTYIDGMKSRLSNQKLHTDYKQFLTTTGRLSSTDPNLQNIPAKVNLGGEIRRMFVPSSVGGKLVAADYSQIELRLLAHLSSDLKLIEAFKQGEDIHTATAALMFNVDTSMVTPHMRKQAKAINFGIIYGKGDFSLAKELHIYRREAKSFIEQYFANYPSVRGYLDSVIAGAKSSGEVTTILGRKRKLPDIKSSNFVTRSHAERAATNMPLQGSSADIIKLAMVKVYDKMNEMKLKSQLILQVHDELIVDCVAGEIKLVEKILKEEMEGVLSLSVPLTVETEVGNNWYEV